MIATTTIDARPAPTTDNETAVSWFLVGCLSDRAGLTRIGIGKTPFSIGRGSAADFCLPSRNVSKLHAEILVAVDTVLVRDAGSTNGTFVNGRRIEAPTPVGDGDLLQFADMEFRLEWERAEPGEHTAVSESPEDGWLISRLHEVMNCRRLRMVFQPIVAAHDLQPTAVEALVRCDVPGLESPIRLFEAAAQLGLEERLSTLCRTEAVASLGDRAPGWKLFLNTHPSEYLGAELLQSLGRLRDQAASRPIVLEIHEAAVPDLETMRAFRDALRDLQIGLAYDDFGAGQSRLRELTQVPPDYLKFDRSLLKDIATASASHRSLIQTLLDYATNAGTATVAEGLDTREGVEICREMGFTHIQGYYVGRPAPADAVTGERGVSVP